MACEHGGPGDAAQRVGAPPHPPQRLFPRRPPPFTSPTLLYVRKASRDSSVDHKWLLSTADGARFLTLKETDKGLRDALKVYDGRGTHLATAVHSTFELRSRLAAVLPGRGKGQDVAVLSDGSSQAGARGRWAVHWGATARSPAALYMEPLAVAAARGAPAVVAAASDDRPMATVAAAADGKTAEVRLAAGTDPLVVAWLAVCGLRWRKKGRGRPHSETDAISAGLEVAGAMIS